MSLQQSGEASPASGSGSVSDYETSRWNWMMRRSVTSPNGTWGSRRRIHIFTHLRVERYAEVAGESPAWRNALALVRPDGGAESTACRTCFRVWWERSEEHSA